MRCKAENRFGQQNGRPMCPGAEQYQGRQTDTFQILASICRIPRRNAASRHTEKLGRAIVRRKQPSKGDGREAEGGGGGSKSREKSDTTHLTHKASLVALRCHFRSAPTRPLPKEHYTRPHLSRGTLTWTQVQEGIDGTYVPVLVCCWPQRGAILETSERLFAIVRHRSCYPPRIIRVGV